jgi:hypothetical protein
MIWAYSNQSAGASKVALEMPSDGKLISLHTYNGGISVLTIDPDFDVASQLPDGFLQLIALSDFSQIFFSYEVTKGDVVFLCLSSPNSAAFVEFLS